MPLTVITVASGHQVVRAVTTTVVVPFEGTLTALVLVVLADELLGDVCVVVMVLEVVVSDVVVVELVVVVMEVWVDWAAAAAAKTEKRRVEYCILMAGKKPRACFLGVVQRTVTLD